MLCCGFHSHSVLCVFVPGDPVQEDERNSSEVSTTHHPGRDLVGLSQTSFTRTAPVSQEVVTRKEGVRGRLDEDLEQSHGPQSVSGPSSQDQELLHPTSPLQGLTEAGRADRKALPLPEEGPNNGAETSGAAHLTDSPVSSTEGTRPYFHTQHTFTTDSSNTATGATNSGEELGQAQMVSTDATASNSETPDAETRTFTVGHTRKHADTHANTAAHPTGSSFTVPRLTSPHSELSSQAAWDGGTILITYGGAASEEKQTHSWRNQQSPDLTSTVTSDPLKSTEPQQRHTISAHTDSVASASASSTQGPSRTQSSAAHITELHTAHSSSHPNISQPDSFEAATSDAVSRPTTFQSSDPFDSTMKIHTPTASSRSRTNSPQSTEMLAHPPYTSASLVPTAMQRNSMNASMTADAAAPSPDIITDDDTTSGLTSLHSTLVTTAQTLVPAHTHIQDNQSTNSQPLTPLLSASSMQTPTPSYVLHPHASSHLTDSPLAVSPSVTESHTITTPLQPSDKHATKSASLLTQTVFSLPDAHNPPHNYVTTHISLPSLTTAEPDPAGSRATDKDESWQRLPSNAATRPPTPPSWLTPHPNQQSHLTSAHSWSSRTSQAPRFYIVPDLPAAVKGTVCVSSI